MISFMSNAAQENVYLKYYKGTHSKNTTVLRSPQQPSIDVIYDNEARQILVSGEDDIEAQVFLCDTDGTLLDYSTTINAKFDVPEKWTNRKNSFDRIKEMIDNDHPLVICGVPKYKITNAHAWNIDGYRTSKRGSKDIKMVHCDFGWGGKYNGYYLDNVFNLGSEDNIYDNNNHSGDDKKLNHHNRILVYD